jgi:heptosyltransferase-1
MPTDGRPRFLICRQSAIGDCVLTLPMVCALRAAFPDAAIIWALPPPAAVVIEGHPAVDEFILLPKRWYGRLRGIVQTRRRLRGLGIDVALDPQTRSKSALAAWFSGAPRRLGFAGERRPEFAPWFLNELVPLTTTHLVDRSIEMLRPLGVEPPAGPRFDLPIEPAAREAMDRWLTGVGLQPGGFALLNPGATWDSKLWPAERFGQVAARLDAELGLRSVVVWAGEREQGWAGTIVEVAAGSAIAAPATSLRELAALAAAARLFVASDTGPLHIAVAAGTPSVGLYGPTRPADCGPYGEPHIALQAWYQAGSHRQRRRAPNDALRAITVDDVVAACLQLAAATA